MRVFHCVNRPHALALAQSGIVNLVRHRGNGLLYPETEPEEAIGQILHILENVQMSQRMSKASVKMSKKFRWDKTSDRSVCFRR